MASVFNASDESDVKGRATPCCEQERMGCRHKVSLLSPLFVLELLDWITFNISISNSVGLLCRLYKAVGNDSCTEESKSIHDD